MWAPLEVVGMKGPAIRVRIYVGEADRCRGHPTHQAILQMLRREGYPGATVIRAIAGFGKASKLHTASILRLSEDLPLIVEVILPEEQVQALLASLSEMGVRGLVTADRTEVYQYGQA